MKTLSKSIICIAIFLGAVVLATAALAQLPAAARDLEAIATKAPAGPFLPFGDFTRLLSTVWVDGTAQNTQDFDCIMGTLGTGTSVQVGVARSPSGSSPLEPYVGEVYYLRVDSFTTASACTPPYVYFEVKLPDHTSLAISTSTNIRCDLIDNNYTPPRESIYWGGSNGCPGALTADPVYPGFYIIPSTDAAHGHAWPSSSGQYLEFDIPVISTATMDGTTDASTFTSAVHVIQAYDSTGNDNWLHPYVGVVVYNPPAPPAPTAFNKSAPTNGATNQSINPTLSWTPSSGLDAYYYCINTSTNCTNWLTAGTATSVALINLSPSTTYYWQVKAMHGTVTTFADVSATAFRSFTTGPKPVAFSKTAPAAGATGQPVSLTLSWGASSAGSTYYYCYDKSNDSNCTNWTTNNSSTSVILSLDANSTYYWQVKATNSFGTTFADGSLAAFRSFTTGSLPPVFNKSSPASGATNQSLGPTLSWGASSGATFYYCIDTSNDNACSTWVSNGTATSKALSGLTASHTYYWQVKAVNSVGATYANASATSFWSFTTGAKPPAFNKSAPTTGATNQPANATLSWGTSSGATFYYCYDTTNDSACSTWVSNGTAASKALSGLAANTTYYWQVRATNSFGTTYANASTTSFWSFKTGTVPGAFNKSAPANGATNQPANATLSWGASTGATKYYYCYDTTNDNACSTWVSNSTATSKALSGLARTTTYYWQVKATNTFGTTYANASATSFRSFTTGTVPPAFNKSAPANGATNQPTSTTLSWGTSSGATFYYCYDTTNDNACSTWVNNGTAASKALSGLAANTTYYWQVKAVNTFGTTYADASATSYRSFKTGLLPPAFNKSAPASGATNQSLTPTLSWGASSGATFYYCYDTSNDNACSSWVSNGTATSKALSGLAASTTYYWQVKAVNSIGTTYANASATSFWSFTTGAKPTNFNKSAPTSGANNQPANTILSWGSSTGVSNFYYCYDTTNDNACTSWIDNGTVPSVALSNLSASTVYYWQVEAVNPYGTTYANESSTAFWSFTTGAAPGAFEKVTPSNLSIISSGMFPKEITFSWKASSSDTTSYEYCIDNIYNSICNSSWVPVGNNTSVNVDNNFFLNTIYSWQVRARNDLGFYTEANGTLPWWRFTLGK